ncbi:MAG: hypothetical protein U9R75_08975 [Candidatus Thermoplasmatota archaeon]|nr:hypothetical protein [Candidatus Thermoplasmatota archaeon]
MVNKLLEGLVKTISRSLPHSGNCEIEPPMTRRNDLLLYANVFTIVVEIIGPRLG